MFDIGWSELVVIGVVALVVIGPKDLPGALRQMGKWMGTVRRMASDFQGQFNEALREAELDELRREVQNLKSGVSGLADPIRTAGNEVKSLVETKPASTETKVAPPGEIAAVSAPLPDTSPPAAAAAPPASKPRAKRAPKAEASKAEPAKRAPRKKVESKT